MSCQFTKIRMNSWINWKSLFPFYNFYYRSCSETKVFLEILQNSQDNMCQSLFFKKLHAKNRLWHRFLPVDFAKFLRSLFLTEHLRRRATRGGEGEGGDLPCPILKIKKCPNFRKKGPDCVHPYVKFTIQYVVLRVSKRKSFKIFFWNFWRNVYRSALISRNLPSPEKFLVARLLRWLLLILFT